MPKTINWSGLVTIPAKVFTCGHADCGESLAPNHGLPGQDGSGQVHYIYICHFCNRPTYISDQGAQVPGVAFGRAIEHLPAEVEELYNEARDCMSVNACIGAVLCCRKLLMNVAVEKLKAEEGKSFVEYINILKESGHLTKGSEHWADHIREKGNEATHKIRKIECKEAEDLIVFIEHLLADIYEFPEKLDITKAESGEETK